VDYNSSGRMGLHINPHRRYRLWLSWYMRPGGRGFSKTISRRSHSRSCKCILRAREQLLTAQQLTQRTVQNGHQTASRISLYSLSTPYLLLQLLLLSSVLPPPRNHHRIRQSDAPPYPPVAPTDPHLQSPKRRLARRRAWIWKCP
jgi:hypothetical protein